MPDMPKAPPCMTLAQDPKTRTVDVCGLEAGHTGPHEGKYKGMIFEGRGRKVKILNSGTRKSTIHEIPPQHGEPPEIRRRGGVETTQFPLRAKDVPGGFDVPREATPVHGEETVPRRRRRVRTGKGRRHTIVEG